MTEAQLETLWECVVEVEHLSKNTTGKASIILADLGHTMRTAALRLEEEGLIEP